MLVEFLQHLSLPMPKWAKQMGYGRETVALEARHRRCAAHWAPHLEACRELIIGAAEACPKTGKAVVLGSGPLLDVPLEELAARFAHVDLVDLAHPKSAIKRAASHPNVQLVTADISGIARAVYHQSITAEPVSDRPAAPIGLRDSSCKVIADAVTDAVRQGDRLGALPDPGPNPEIIVGADLVVSANVLSQLPLLLLGWLESHRPFADDADALAFARGVVDHHLAWLQNHPGQVVLISEVMRLIADGETPLEKIDPLFGTQILAEGTEWWWEMAPKGELRRDADVRVRMLGIPDLANAPQSRICRNTTLAAP